MTEEGLRAMLPQMRIARLITEYPESRTVLFSHFGASCFDCPACQEETVELGVRVHCADAETFYKDLMAEICTHKAPEDLPLSPLQCLDKVD